MPSSATTRSSVASTRSPNAYTGKITCCENCLGAAHDLFFLDAPQPTVELLRLGCGDAKQQCADGV